MKSKAHFSVILFFASFSLILLTLGGGGTFYSVEKLYGNFNLLLFGNKTDAKITGYEGSYSTNSKGQSTRMYAPTIQYRDNKGILREYHSDYSSSGKENDDNVVIYYNPEKPSKAVRGGFLNVFFFPFLILCFSLLSFSIGRFIAIPLIKDIKNNISKRKMDEKREIYNKKLKNK